MACSALCPVNSEVAVVYRLALLIKRFTSFGRIEDGMPRELVHTGSYCDIFRQGSLHTNHLTSVNFQAAGDILPVGVPAGPHPFQPGHAVQWRNQERV